MAAGYSKRSLPDKLGIKDSFKIALVGAPERYDTALGIPRAIVMRSERLGGPLDFVQFFCKEKQELEKRFPTLKQALAPDGMLWVSWPKRSSGVKTDLNENIIRGVGLKNGLVDVKVCAVDETWSGPKFVYRSKDRK
jgi:hypothetical protein